MPDKPSFLNEKAEYEGKKVDLNNPFRAPKGSPKKFYVYVRNEKGNVIKLGFGDPNMEIKRDDPDRIKNFRSRHNCSDPGPKYKARYWSCKFWEKGKKVSDLTKQGKVESTECDCGCGCSDEVNEKQLHPDLHKIVKTRDGYQLMMYSPSSGKFIPQGKPQPTERKAQKASLVFASVTNEDEWSKEYKDSIDCNNPKGFSQRAHCQGRKKNEDKKYYTKSGKIKKSPEDKESGLPKKYVSGLSDKEAKQKAKEIKRRMSLPKDHPDAYKPVDDVEDPSISKTKKKQSKYTLKYKQMFGEGITQNPEYDEDMQGMNIGEEVELHESLSDIKGWIHPKTKKSYITKRMTPYHVQFIVQKPRDFGITVKDILGVLEKWNDSMDSPDPAEDAKDDFLDLKTGKRDMQKLVEYLAMEKGWYRVVGADWSEITGLKINDKIIHDILNIMEDEGVIPFAGKGIKSLVCGEYRPDGDYMVEKSIKILEGDAILRALRGKRTGKQTEIGRTMAMFRGESVSESEFIPHKKRKWTELPTNVLGKNNDVTQDIFDMIVKSYGPIGGYPDFKKPSDLPSDSTNWIAVDTDKEPDFDAVRFSKPGPGGQKMTGSATDGSDAAKKMLINKTAKMLETKGNYAEMSGAIAHIMITRKGVPYVADEESARRLLPGKDIEWVGKHPDGKYPGYDGWYYRMLGGKKHIKIILGKPNGAVVQNPT